MKKLFVSSVVMLSLLAVAVSANAQSKYGKKKGTTTPSTTQPATTTPAPATTQPATTAPSGGSKYGKKKTTTTDPGTAPATTDPNAGTTPTVSTGAADVVVYDTTVAEGGIGQKVKRSLRSGGLAIQRNEVLERKPLPWEHIRDDDAVYSQLVWREIDAREKINLPFIYSAQEDNGDTRFFSILMQAIAEDSVMAFSTDDDRFTTPYPKENIMKELAYTMDTIDVPDPISGQTVRTITKGAKLNPDSVYKFRLKEQYIFDKESSRMFVRIIGICPVARMKPTKSSRETVDKPLFWVYYPDLRPTLAKHDAYNPKNYFGRMTWEDVFENRYFSGYIYKSTVDNPFNKRLAELIKDPLFRLLEGENIKEKIFNYEQDLWSY